jgi:hypothetical protein
MCVIVSKDATLIFTAECSKNANILVFEVGILLLQIIVVLKRKGLLLLFLKSFSPHFDPQSHFVASTSDLFGSHHAEGLVDPNLMYKKNVTGFRYSRACSIRKYQIVNRLKSLPLVTFFKT